MSHFKMRISSNIIPGLLLVVASVYIILFTYQLGVVE